MSADASGPSRRVGPFPIALVLAAAIALAWSPTRPPLPGGALADDRTVDRLLGEIRGPVTRTDRGHRATLVTGEAEVIVWTDAMLAPGDRIAAYGLVRTTRGHVGPAMIDRRASAERYELSATRIEHRGEASGLRAWIWRHAVATQATWAARIDDADGDAAARAALRGIVTGDRHGIPPALDERWRAVGIYHVLSVSGLHLAVVAGLLYALLRRLVAASPWGGRVRPACWAAPPALVLAIAYTLVTGAQLATVRALVVVALVLIAQMLDRPLRLLDAIGVAAIAILAVRPGDVFDPSFQLSFTAALALAVLPRIEARGVRGWIVRGLVASVWVTIATSPLTAYHFHQVTPGGVVGNLVLGPLVELFALPLGLAGVVLDVPLLVEVAVWIVAQVDALAGVLATAAPIGRIAVASAPVAAALVALSLVLAARRPRTHLDLVLWLALIIAWGVARTPPAPGALRVTFLDVGQGDAALLELPDGAVWLVDAGGHASARALPAAAATGDVITRALTASGHDRIDLAIVSHPHPDHYLGLVGIPVPVTELWSARELEAHAAGGPRSFGALTATLAARGTRLVHPPLGVARAQAGVELVVWGPRYEQEALATGDPVRSVNDNSLVVEVRYAGRSILFTGDLEVEGESLLVAAGVGHVDVVKVPHHGSPTSSAEELVEATRPALAVISCGRGNAFGFPADDVVARWEAQGAAIARTDQHGAVTVLIDPTGDLVVDRFVVQSARGDLGSRSRDLRRSRREGQRTAEAGQSRGGPALVPDRARARTEQHARARPARPDLLPR